MESVLYFGNYFTVFICPKFECEHCSDYSAHILSHKKYEVVRINSEHFRTNGSYFIKAKLIQGDDDEDDVNGFWVELDKREFALI